MRILMIGHLLGDFYFQTNELAEKKKESFGATLWHCLIYFFVIYGMYFMSTGNQIQCLLPAMLIGTSHLLIDGGKYVFYKEQKTAKNEMVIFLADQISHLIVLFLINYLFRMDGNTMWLSGELEDILGRFWDKSVMVIAFLVCGKPAAVFVSLVFGMIPQTIEMADEKENKSIKEKQENAKIGSWIGILEREIILILGLLGEYGAIGFVVAAKSLARHSRFDNNPAFGEKYLIGTLLSTFIALICILIC